MQRIKDKRRKQLKEPQYIRITNENITEAEYVNGRAVRESEYKMEQKNSKINHSKYEYQIAEKI